MALTVTDAYTQIKNLENSGQIPVPEPRATVEIGTIDPTAGTFTWSVPTVVQTTTIPPVPGTPTNPGQSSTLPMPGQTVPVPTGPGPGAPSPGPWGTNKIVNVTVGVVATTAVDLLLKFAVVPVRTKPENAPANSGANATPSGSAASFAIPMTLVSTSTPAPSIARTGALAGVVDGFSGITTVETNGGVTVSGFPTISSTATEIVVDAGLACSSVNPVEQNTSPPVTNFGMTVNIPGLAPINVFIFILRPPFVGMGAFTIPALPMTIVYAPPQGKLLKNTATYSDTDTFTRTVTSAITSNTNTKSVQAYSVADLIGKVTAAIGLVVAVVGTGGAAAPEAPTIAGAFQEFVAAIAGKPKDDNDSTASATQAISANLNLIAGILNAVDINSTTTSNAVQTETDNSLTLTVSEMSQYSSEAGLGPGAGDRILYLSNVRAVWTAVNGDVGIHIFGFDSVAANSVQDLLQEQQRITNGGSPTLGLDAATIASLLSLDPLVPKKPTLGTGALVTPPLIGPPRFVPADPPGRKGTGTGSMPDTFQATVDTTVEDKQVTLTTQTTVTDFKPGWVSVLFGEDDTETTTTTTLSNSQTVDIKTDDKIVSTITFVSQGLDDPYDVKVFKDFLFGTYAIVDSNSSALQGATPVIEVEPVPVSA